MNKLVFGLVFFILIAIPKVALSSEPILRQGSTGEEVKKIQLVLKEENYYFDKIDGLFGPETRYAVIAFQKVNEIHVDGIVGPQTRSSIQDIKRPVPLFREENIHIEVNLEKQLLFVVEDEEIIGISHISSGAPGRETPKGRFEIPRIEKIIRQTRNVPWRATLFYPIQIRGAYLIHGFNEFEGGIPLYPASRGCIRTSISFSYWLSHHPKIEKGTVIHIY